MKKEFYKRAAAGMLAVALTLQTTGCGSKPARIIWKDGQETSADVSDAADLQTETDAFADTADSAEKEAKGGSVPDGESAQTETEKQIVIDICGAVKTPGVYTLPEGSRVCDAVQMAGGLTEEADADVLNQAAVLSDADKIVVCTKEEIAAMLEAQGTSAWTSGYSAQTVSGIQGAQTQTEESVRVNINTADVSQLCTLNGIGEARANDIIAYRTQNGAFSSTEEIMNVSGIKEATYNKIKDEITVG